METTILDGIGRAISEELGDLPSAESVTRMALRLTMSALLAGAVGIERERQGKPAGIRTHMLVALGATLLVAVPHASGMDDASVSRIIQGVISGIGFLGAGAILKTDGGGVKGLTTATTLWLAVGIGITVGLGRLMAAVAAVLAALIILSLASWIERRLPRKHAEPEDSKE